MIIESEADPVADMRAAVGSQQFACILADPSWQFLNCTGKMAPEHNRLSRYGTMNLPAIAALNIVEVSAATVHLSHAVCDMPGLFD